MSAVGQRSSGALAPVRMPLVRFAAPALLVALALHGWASALLAALGYVVIGSVPGNVVEPAAAD